MSENGNTPTPAYLSYTTFKNTTRSLLHNGSIPRRIDQTVLPTMGGSSRKMFLGGLKFFGLIDDDGLPSKQLSELAAASDSEWKDYLQVMLQEKYPGLINGLDNTSPKLLREQFIETFTNIGPSLVEPSIRFLVSAARDADVSVSPLLTTRKPRSPGAPRKHRTSRIPKQNVIEDEAKVPSHASDEQSFRMALMDKFPSFDPSWGEAQQQAWFEAYGKLLAMTSESEKKNDPV